ncbi:hypothetical protein ACFLQN_03215 [Candidatus Aenigmatarchaeota archaeon]
MPRKRKPIQRKKNIRKKRIPKNENKWDETFGKPFEKWGERCGKRFEKCFKGKTCKCFGPLSPLLNSIFEIVVLAIFIAIIGWLNTYINFSFLQSIVNFISVNLHWIFIFTLFKNYLKYLSNVFDTEILKPINVAIGIIVALWVIAGILQVHFLTSQSHMLFVISEAILSNTWVIFSFLLVVGYIVFVAMCTMKDHMCIDKRKR